MPTRPSLLSPDDLHDMALFTAVSRAGSLTQAAAQSGIPKATLSRRIAALEKRLGVALLNRGGGRLTLTAEGRWYQSEAEQIVQRAELLHDGLSAQRNEPTGLVRINAAPDIAEHSMAGIVADFMLRYPQIKVVLEQHPERVDLVERGCDIAVRVGALPDSSLCARKIGDLSRVLLAAPAYLARAGIPGSPEALAQHRCIRFIARNKGTETRWHLSRGDAQQVIALPDEITTNTAGTATALAEAGAGIALSIPEYCSRALAEGRLVRVLPEWRGQNFSVYAVTLTRRQPNRVRLLLDFMAEAFARQPPPV
ncbi:LysR family transcriptional regulator [Niveibacterium sp. SC-1]|uniref:LysR family transcriptional regulator n=1 Tax=Niveibacterium sp. SC-1 TaxID=3135646 RepID=UPI00311FF352